MSLSSTRASGRTQTCSKEQARTRLGHARKFLEVAEMTAGESGDIEYASAAAALAVLAGIAASDAACCAALGRRARGGDSGGALAQPTSQSVRLADVVEAELRDDGVAFGAGADFVTERLLQGVGDVA